MIQISAVLLVMVSIFGYIGYQRGWNKEIISTSGVILGVFALYQFDDLIRLRVLGNIPGDQVFIIQSAMFITIVFFAYQTRALQQRLNDTNQRDKLQTSVLGGLTGMLNGYMIVGTLWYLMELNNYPMSPYITAPTADTTNATVIAQIRSLIEGGAGGNGEPLTIAVIVLFLIVLIVI